MPKHAGIITINGRWRLEGVLGIGGFGCVYLATDLKTDKLVAVKTLRVSEDSPLAMTPTTNQAYTATPYFQPSLGDIQYEALYYSFLSGLTGIAAVHDHGHHVPNLDFMVCDLLGASLGDLFDHCRKQFSLKTTLMLADQLISRLEAVHSRNVLHRDVKPENFAMGFGKKNGQTVYILDFGMVCTFSPTKNYAAEPDYGFLGTYPWASIAAHLHRPPSPKDDLESLAYMLIYFIRGSLPWKFIKDSNEYSDSMNKHITKLKLSLPIDIICQGAPSEFARHLRYVRSLKYTDKPNYGKLRDMYRRLMKRMGYQYDGVYDWDLNEVTTGSIGIQQKGAKQRGAKQQVGCVIPASVQDKPAEEKKEPVAKKIAKKRKIVLTKEENDEDQPPKRKRGRPAAAEKNKADTKKTKKDVAKKAPAKKPVARKKACK